jgi:hypothetical protein
MAESAVYAFVKCYNGDNPDRIWIVFISVLYKDKGIYYYTQHLARKFGQDETIIFKDE